MTCTYVPNITRLREAIVARLAMTLTDFGIDGDPQQFVDRLGDVLAEMYPGLTIDALLVRPREALRLCDAARQREQCYDLPDDVILQAMLNRRKNG